MEIKSSKFSMTVVAAVFLGGLAGSAFMYQDMGNQIDSLQGKLEDSKQTEIVYVNGSDGSLAPLFEKVDQSVVYIEVEGDESSQSSGFVYNKRGHIVTNEHVVEGAEDVEVSFTDGSTRAADVVGTDPYSDLAVLKVEKSNLQPLNIGNSSQVRPGQKAVAMGNPFGLRGSMTVGYVSQVGRSLPVQEIGLEGFRIRDVIQTDASINPGNSGGPLLNIKGEVIGVNTAIETNTGTFSGIGFAVPANTVKRVVPDMIAQGEAEHPWIGVRGLTVNEDLAEEMDLNSTKGFLVMNVSADGPAEEAAIQPGNRTVTIEGREYTVGGDVIVAINSQEMRDIEDILSFLAREVNVGEEVTVTVIRDGERVKVPLVLQDRPE